MTTETQLDPGKMEAGMNMIVGNLAGAMLTYMSSVGDRLGLFKDLAQSGPATSGEFANRNGISERYAREWLSCLTCGGYIEHDPATGTFALPDEYAPILAEEGHPMFLGALLGSFGALEKAGTLAHLSDAFRTGAGIPQQVFGDDWQVFMERLSSPWYDHQLIQEWLVQLPELCTRLEAGADVADVGCGAARALIRLAEAYPNSRFTGFDQFSAAISLARAKARAADVDARVRFEQVDASRGLSGKFDLITAFDVLHDAADPKGLLRSIRQALKPGGTVLIVEINCGDSIEANAGPMGAALYAVSTIYCMSTSLAAGGAALGTMGLPESALASLAKEVGFSSVRRIAEDPFNAIYELRP
jgi:2-polyprenyl-3-methyl-5-hydroxy-6-metoxy-1,4-benzoquinol methylase